MRRGITIAAGVAAGTIVALEAANSIGMALWRGETRRTSRRLGAPSLTTTDARGTQSLSDVALAGLPDPVARYFAYTRATSGRRSPPSRSSRFLAEAPWLPTALLPGDHLTWTAIDATRAHVTLRDRGTTPWSGTFHEYTRVDGMRVPMAAEVAWAPPERPFSVWRGRISDARYAFAP